MNERFKNLRKKCIAVIAIAAIIASGSGCGKKETAEIVKREGKATYPVEAETTLTYWCPLPASLADKVKDFGETEFAKELEKRTGIKVKYIHPVAGQESEALNLFIASGEMPDIIQTNWLGQTGGPQSFIDDDVIIELNDIMEKNLTHLPAYLKENPDLDRMIKTDEGKYYCFPAIVSDELLMTTNGFMIRNDWLKKVSMDVPQTIDDWYEVLTAFKNKLGVESPLSLMASQISNFAGAYGVSNTFYMDDGKVKLGPAEDGYKQYLMTMKKWYDEGLLDKDFAVMDIKQYNYNILSERSGATHGAGGGQLGYFLNAFKDSGSSFDIKAAPYPVLKEGDPIEFGAKRSKYNSSASAAITTSCKDPVLAAWWLDYSYSLEGHMLNNFGVEGEDYEMIDGYPTYTEKITNNPDGLSIIQAMSMNIRANNSFPIIQDKRYIEQYYELPQQLEALEIWQNDSELHAIPPVTYTSEESSEYASLKTEIDAFIETNTLNFILGKRSFKEWDKYIAELENLNYKRVIEIIETAIDRYSSR
ncbi:MAG: extracellular solute-binding protein [Clostridia bacterium]|nr:extracellular solute-binding protein [Clostridia bacterium]